MDSTEHLYPQEVITPEGSPSICVLEDTEAHSPAWLERELADTAAWLESNLHQFRPANRSALALFAGNLREAAGTARRTQNMLRADSGPCPEALGRMGPLEREVSGLAMWLAAEIAGKAFDGREKRLLEPLCRHVSGIAGQCAELEQRAEPARSDDMAEALKALNLHPRPSREE